MARGYHIYEIEQFPDITGNSKITLDHQLSLLTDYIHTETLIEIADRNFNKGWVKCKIHHEIKINQIGRTALGPFTEYIRPYDFDAYINKAHNFIAFAGKGDVVADAVNLMNRQPDKFQLVRKEIELRKILPQISYIKGAWWKLDKPNLKTQAMFGDHVDLDVAFQKIMKNNDGLSSLMMNYEYGTELIHVTLMEDCGVVFYTNMNAELDLDILLEIKQSLLDTSIKAY